MNKSFNRKNPDGSYEWYRAPQWKAADEVVGRGVMVLGYVILAFILFLIVTGVGDALLNG